MSYKNIQSALNYDNDMNLEAVFQESISAETYKAYYTPSRLDLKVKSKMEG